MGKQARADDFPRHSDVSCRKSHRGLAVLDARAHALKVSLSDETGLTGYYDGDLEYTIPLTSQLEQFPPTESLPDAVVRQLGLTLELRRAPGKVLVIRSSDRTPTENRSPARRRYADRSSV